MYFEGLGSLTGISVNSTNRQYSHTNHHNYVHVVYSGVHFLHFLLQFKKFFFECSGNTEGVY